MPMKTVYEFRSSKNGRCAHFEYLDYLVAELCHVPLDEKLYTVPAGNSVNWLLLTNSIVCKMGVQRIRETQPIAMDYFIEAVENDATGKTVDFKKPFVEIFKMFKRMGLLLHVELIADDDDPDLYKTKEPEKWFTLEELVQLNWDTKPAIKSGPAWWPDWCCSYEELMENDEIRQLYSIYKCGDHMTVFSRKGWGEKETYLVNTATKQAFHLVDRDGFVRAFMIDDIEPSVFDAPHTWSAKELKLNYAKLSIGDFVDGKAKITWMLYPDGSYFADDGGFGRKDNREVNIEAVIDENCKVIEKFKLFYGE